SQRTQERIDPVRLRRASIVAVGRALGIAERRQIDRETAEAPVAERGQPRKKRVGGRHRASDEDHASPVLPAPLLIADLAERRLDEAAGPRRPPALFGLAERRADP